MKILHSLTYDDIEVDICSISVAHHYCAHYIERGIGNDMIIDYIGISPWAQFSDAESSRYLTLIILVCRHPRYVDEELELALHSVR
jgi:hypothetical protein